MHGVDTYPIFLCGSIVCLAHADSIPRPADRLIGMHSLALLDDHLLVKKLMGRPNQSLVGTSSSGHSSTLSAWEWRVQTRASHTDWSYWELK